MIKRIPIVFLFIILFFSGCKKNDPVGSPVVQIVMPSKLTVFKVFDTIQVKANVSDANSLKSVTVYITNSSNVQVLPTTTISVTGKSMSFTCPYVLNDIHLSAGEYTIVVRAYNGTNVTLGFQQIYIDAAPVIRLGIYAITRNSSGIHVEKLDSNYNVSTVYTVGGDYSSSDVSSYYQQLYVAAADSGNFNALNLPSASPAWTVPGIISSTPYFTNTYSSGDAVYISQYNGLIKYFNHSGAAVISITVPTGNYAIKTYVWNNYLIAEEKNIGSANRNLVLYYASSGANYEQNAIPGPVVAIFGMDVNNVFVFGNQNTGGAYLQLFNIPGNIFYSPIPLPGANLLSVAQVNAQTYLLSFSNGTIYSYTYNPNSIVPAISGVTASHLQYDSISNRVIASAGKYVYEYDLKTSALLHSANLQDSVLNIHLLYNK